MAEQSLRILQISTSDKQGGAEKVALNLFSAYRERGHNSRLAVGIKHREDPDILLIPNETSRGRWYRFFKGLSLRLQAQNRETWLVRLAGILAEPIKRFNTFRGVEDFDFPGTSRLLKLDQQSVQILHAHNLHGSYFDLRMLPRLSHQVPLVMTLHDAWLLSGHCAHSFECERWKAGCGHCPDLGIYPSVERDATAHNWRRKQDIFLRSRLFVATPSHWLMQRVQNSILAASMMEARVIPNGVDLAIFHPGKLREARSRLGISQSARMLLSTGVRMRDSLWRDFQMMRESVIRAGRFLEGQDLLLIVLGGDAPTERYDNVEIRFVPFQEDSLEVARYYHASEIYLHAARADTFPTSVLEALACGIPVVATAVGGIPEQVEDSRTGFLVPLGKAEAMTIRVTQLLQDHDLRKNMQHQAAEAAAHKFDLEHQVDAYLEWYRELIREAPADKIASTKVALKGTLDHR